MATEAAAPLPAAAGPRSRSPAPLVWLAALLAVYLAAPLLAGIRQAWLADWHSIEAAALARACAVSLASASVATAIIAVGGVPLGWLLARRPGRGMAALGFVVQLPLALPPLTSGILLLFLVGYSQPLGRLTAGALTDSFAGIVLAEVFVAAPFLVIAARSAFAAIDPVLEGVGATLGRGPVYIFFRVSLPIAWPGISSGMLLAWLRAFGEFGATVMVAYHPYSLPVYTYVAFGAQGLPAMLPILLPTLVLAVVVMGLSEALGRRRERNAAPAAPAPAADRFAAIATTGAAANPGDADDARLTLDLAKRLGDFRLRLNWAPRSRRLAILGPSGSGKSLSLRLIAGIEPADEARIVVAGRDIAQRPPAGRGIGYVPQSYGLFPHLSVAGQLSFPDGAEPGRARYWLDRLALAGLERRLPSALSLGQQQRVALARALVRPVRLLLFDEPFSALDAPMRRQLRAELLDLQGEFGAIFLIVTHDPDEAALLADEILVLEHGRVLQSGATADVFQRPASETVARLLGAENAALGVAVGEHAIAIGGGIVLEAAGPPLAKGRRIGWSAAAGRIRICDDGRYRGSIEAVVRGGLGCRIGVCVGDAHLDIFETHSERLCGTPCRLDIDPYAVRVWPRD